MNPEWRKYLIVDNTAPTGLRWLVDVGSRARAGTPAFTALHTTGYYRGRFQGKAYFAHRVVFYLTHGYCPKTVDHIDGDILNNSPDNLRDAVGAINQQNRVCRGYSKRNGRYEAYIRANGSQQYLGGYGTEEEAHAAYLSAKRVHHAGLVEARYV